MLKSPESDMRNRDTSSKNLWLLSTYKGCISQMSLAFGRWWHGGGGRKVKGMLITGKCLAQKIALQPPYWRS